MSTLTYQRERHVDVDVSAGHALSSSTFYEARGQIVTEGRKIWAPGNTKLVSLRSESDRSETQLVIWGGTSAPRMST